jgi:lysophospholipase L1-like esterase
MKRITLVLLAILAGCSFTFAQLAPSTMPTTAPGARGRGPAGPPPSATTPVIQRGTDNRHADFLAIAKAGNIDLLFIGDSITDNWRRPGPRGGQAVWDKYFAPLKAANFGIGADRTQNVLFRVQNGELEGFQAKLIVMMLGTNNIGTPQQPRNTVADTIEGYKLIVKEIRERQPQAKLLLLAIFPRADAPSEGHARGDAPNDGHREGIAQVNDFIKTLADNKSIFFMDINQKFLQLDGTLTAEIMPDFLHPSEKGYEIWAETTREKVKELMATP